MRGALGVPTLGDLVAALLALLTASIAAEVIYSTLGVTRLSLLFLAAVIVVASVRGRRAAVAAAFMGVIFYNLFLAFRTNQQTSAVEDMLNLVVFLIVALLTGTVAGKMHDEAANSRLQADRMKQLFETSRRLTDEQDQSFWSTIVESLSRVTGASAIALDAAGAVQAQSGSLRAEEAAHAIEIGRERLQPTGKPLDVPGRWTVQLVSTQSNVAGAAVWDSEGADADVRGVVELLGELASASLSRSHAREEQVRAQAAEETGRLRQALLSSISHDFRSPLAAIIGSSSSLLEYGDKFTEPVRRDLLQNICDEGEKLNEFVANLLTLTRIQSGIIQPASHPLSLRAIISDALERLKRHRGGTPDVRVEGDCQIRADGLLLEQAIYNILDNAGKYGDPSRGVDISCRAAGATCTLEIADYGPGLAEQDLSGMFTEFYFARKTGRTTGTGLGLSIARGFIEAMGGSIAASNRSDGASGLMVSITLPVHG